MLGERYDAKVDLWSVGVILYGEHWLNVSNYTYISVSFFYVDKETLFGEAPFASKSFTELESKIRDPNPIIVSVWCI